MTGALSSMRDGLAGASPMGSSSVRSWTRARINPRVLCDDGRACARLPSRVDESLAGVQPSTASHNLSQRGEVGEHRVQRDASRVRGFRWPPHPDSSLRSEIRPLPNGERCRFISISALHPPLLPAGGRTGTKIAAAPASARENEWRRRAIITRVLACRRAPIARSCGEPVWPRPRPPSFPGASFSLPAPEGRPGVLRQGTQGRSARWTRGAPAQGRRIKRRTSP